MKARSSSPQTSPAPQPVRRNRDSRISSGASMTGASSTAGPGLRKSSVRIEDLPNVAMNGFQPFAASPNGTTPISPALLTPAATALRKASAESLTAPRSDSHQTNGLSPSSNNAPTPSSENSPAPWSSAIGHATTSGKSGRVIERLMAENDKLKREANEQRIKCQEMERSLQTYKPQIEALRQENDNLSHARDVDSGLISRRDRKIEELKADLAAERQRREKAEGAARQLGREKDEAEEQGRREIQVMTESTKHATVHAEILETSHKQLAAEYRARVTAFKNDLAQILDAREQDRVKLARMDVVNEQMRVELEKSKKVHEQVVECWGQMRTENEARMSSLEAETREENEGVRMLSAQMDEVVGRMRWVMGLKANRETDGVEEEG